ncbi:protein-L-isoaspartate(D-aspartate) O-methyltransferase [Streptomyces monashensis]|uniref:Protein-L-isoaspartate O-methyltransferase n=2 Tax=Streptomyces monashensis TaxID=1678012 RepID=A0A1S2PA95_9ACTN|nr:protein-L-isoaspartate(D-aspartate) O-methyltransferase [Streptomyces monashensis]
MITPDTDEARRLRRGLASALAEKGDLTDPGWRKVFEKVPRHVFVPEFWLGPDRRLTAADVDWLSHVYTDDVLVTQMTEGAATSSSTAPGLMLVMLHALDVTDGARVLEVATGTGYNAALLAARLGSANVTTIEVDPELAKLAEERLNACGYTPTVLTGDGRAGHPAGTPYDRLIATCGFAQLPYAWVEQVRPGGVIVCPLGWGTVRLTVEDGGTASGRFLATPSYFMTVRSNGETGSVPYPGDPQNPDERATHLDPSAPFRDDAFPFLLSLAVPGTAQASDLDDDRRVIGCRLWAADGSWARVEGDSVRQAGPRRLWGEAEAAWRWWEEQGRPGRDRFGLTVDRDGQRVWLDSTDHLLPVAG